MQTSSPSTEAVWLTITAPKASKGQGMRRSERAEMARFIQATRIERGIGSELFEAKTWGMADRSAMIVRNENIVGGGFMLGMSDGRVYRRVGG
jgi:hypothetical protein